MVSSGIKSLFATFIAFAAIAASTAYGLKHRDQVYKVIGEYSGKNSNTARSKAPESAPEQLDDVEAENHSGNVELKANPAGHFETEADINGRGVPVLVDTGATMVSLTWDDAERAGIYLHDSDFTHQTQTANGIAKVAPIRISEVSVKGISIRDVDGMVAERGKLKQTLLGMSFLKRLSRVEMRGKTLILHE